MWWASPVSGRRTIALGLVAVWCSAACSFGAVDHDARACPCATGFFCNLDNRCVRELVREPDGGFPTIQFDAGRLPDGRVPADAGRAPDGGSPLGIDGGPGPDGGGVPPDAGPPGACPEILPDVVALYDFDAPFGAGTVADRAGKHGALLRGPAEQIAGPTDCGQAIRFGGGSTSYVEVPDDPEWDLPTGSVDFWLYLEAAPTDSAGLVTRDALNQARDGHFAVFLTPAGYLMARFQRNVPGQKVSLCSNASVPLQRWVRITVNWGQPTAELYIDGELATRSGSLVSGIDGPGVTVPCGGNWSDGIDGNDNPWVIGSHSYQSAEGTATPANKPFQRGRLDHLRIRSARTVF